MKRLLRLWISLALIGAMLGLIRSAESSEVTERTTIRVFASKIIANAVENASKGFVAAHPDVNVVVYGGRIVEGFKKFAEKPSKCLAVSSRRMNEAERKAAAENGVDLQEQLLTRRLVGIVTSEEAPVRALTLAQVRGIFTGDIRSWKEVGGGDEPITVFARPDPQDGIAVWFRTKVLEGKPCLKDAHNMSFDKELLRAVARNKGAIGYASVEKTPPSGARFIPLKRDTDAPAVAPSDKTAEDGSYPLFMNIYAYWDKKTAGDKAHALIAFLKNGGL